MLAPMDGLMGRKPWIRFGVAVAWLALGRSWPSPPSAPSAPRLLRVRPGGLGCQARLLRPPSDPCARRGKTRPRHLLSASGEHRQPHRRQPRGGARDPNQSQRPREGLCRPRTVGPEPGRQEAASRHASSRGAGTRLVPRIRRLVSGRRSPQGHRHSQLRGPRARWHGPPPPSAPGGDGGGPAGQGRERPHPRRRVGGPRARLPRLAGRDLRWGPRTPAP